MPSHPLTHSHDCLCSSVHVLRVFGGASAHSNIDKAESESPRIASKPGREETRLRLTSELRNILPGQAVARAPELDLAGRLAKFFPGATPVRIPIKVSRPVINGDAGVRENHAGFLQNTVIEFGTQREVLFLVDCPLEFADRILLETKDGSLQVEATVVAVQYHPQRTVVAARFLKDVPNWIVKS